MILAAGWLVLYDNCVWKLKMPFCVHSLYKPTHIKFNISYGFCVILSVSALSVNFGAEVICFHYLCPSVYPIYSDHLVTPFEIDFRLLLYVFFVYKICIQFARLVLMYVCCIFFTIWKISDLSLLHRWPLNNLNELGRSFYYSYYVSGDIIEFLCISEENLWINKYFFEY